MFPSQCNIDTVHRSRPPRRVPHLKADTAADEQRKYRLINSASRNWQAKLSAPIRALRVIFQRRRSRRVHRVKREIERYVCVCVSLLESQRLSFRALRDTHRENSVAFYVVACDARDRKSSAIRMPTISYRIILRDLPRSLSFPGFSCSRDVRWKVRMLLHRGKRAVSVISATLEHGNRLCVIEAQAGT